MTAAVLVLFALTCVSFSTGNFAYRPAKFITIIKYLIRKTKKKTTNTINSIRHKFGLYVRSLFNIEQKINNLDLYCNSQIQISLIINKTDLLNQNLLFKHFIY